MDRRRDVWLHHEIMALLKLLKEKQIADVMDSKRFRTTDIFKSLEIDINKSGIMRDAKQIQIKYKSLKQNYNNARRALSQSGAGTKVKCPYFDELQEIFGHRPTSIQIGVDSANVTQNKNNGTQFSNIIDLGMYDNIPDTFDGAVPSTSRDGVMPSKIKNSTNVDSSILDKKDDITSHSVSSGIVIHLGRSMVFIASITACIHFHTVDLWIPKTFPTTRYSQQLAK